MPVRATCPDCAVALFSPSEALSAAAMVERHQRFGRCRADAQRPQVERRAVTEEDGRPAAAGARTVRDGRLA
jgi:hypothetical protein